MLAGPPTLKHQYASTMPESAANPFTELAAPTAPFLQEGDERHDDNRHQAHQDVGNPVREPRIAGRHAPANTDGAWLFRPWAAQ